jgi:hypothetical protein
MFGGCCICGHDNLLSGELKIRLPSTRAIGGHAIAQTFEVMMPMRRAVAKAPPGRGERFVFRRTDRPQTWAVRFDGDPVLLGAHADD